MAFERITIDPKRMGGLPAIRDTRVTVSMILGQLAAGRTTEALLENYPYLERDDILAALQYAAIAVNGQDIRALRQDRIGDDLTSPLSSDEQQWLDAALE